MKAGSATKCSDRIETEYRLNNPVTARCCAPGFHLTIIMNTIEHQLTALKPVGQSDLARRILEIPQRKRQRQRDCVVGLAGLFTGIAATVAVVAFLPGRVVEVPVIPAISVIPATAGIQTSGLQPVSLDSGFHRNDRKYGNNDTVPDPLDLNEWIARYEKLLRYRPAAAYKPVVYTSVALPGGASPQEYRNKLLEEYQM